MKKISCFRFLCLAGALLLNVFLFAQGGRIEISTERTTTPTPEELASTITRAELQRHLATLASDEFEGRETGTPGNEKAASYIAGYFNELGLPRVGENNTYYQPINFTREKWEQVSLYLEGKQMKDLKDFYAFPSSNPDRASLRVEEVLFLGYGIDDPKYSDYEGVNVKDKVLLIYLEEPLEYDYATSYLTGTLELSDWSRDWKRKVRLAEEKGAAGVLFIDDKFLMNVSTMRNYLLNNSLQISNTLSNDQLGIPNIFLSTFAAKEIMGKDFDKVVKARDKIRKTGKGKKVKLKTTVVLTMEREKRQVLGNNVLGYIEGSDPGLRDELIVLTAHYDHLGRRGDAIYNGADDNASGTSTLLEICEAFKEASNNNAGSRRSVLFMLVSGEEKGLLGSKYYVQNPVFPLENTVVDINVDMVGRVDKKHEGNPDYIYVIGSDRLSTELHAINEQANATYTQLELDYTYNDENDPNRFYYRSDHYSFAEKGIPAIFYFNGTHEDYHRTSDTVEKINFEKMEKIGRLIFHTAWELANRDQRIKVDVTPRPNDMGRSRG